MWKYRVNKISGILAIVIILLAAIAPAYAQDPIGGAIATLSAATAQAQDAQWRAAQRATLQAQAQDAQATAQAQTQLAQATAQAVQADATRQAHVVNVGSTATSAAQSASATAQAHGASIGATQIAIDAIVTREAQDAQAATQLEASLLAERGKREASVTVAIEAMIIVALIVFTFGIFCAGKMIANRLSLLPIQAEAQVMDVAPSSVLMLPAPQVLPDVREIDDERAERIVGEWFYAGQ